MLSVKINLNTLSFRRPAIQRSDEWQINDVGFAVEESESEIERERESEGLVQANN